MKKKQMSIPQMALELQMVEQTVRRYTHRFSEYFTFEISGGVTRYECPESLNILKRIIELYAQGKKKEDIKEILAEEIQGIKLEVIPDEIPATAAGSRNEFLDVLKGIKNSLDNLVEVIKSKQAL